LVTDSDILGHRSTYIFSANKFFLRKEANAQKMRSTIISIVLVLVFFAALALGAGDTRIIGAPPGTERDRQGATVLEFDPSQQSAAAEEEEAATLRFRRFFSRAFSFHRAAAPIRAATHHRFERASGFSRHVYTRASSGAAREARSARRHARQSARAARREARRVARGTRRISRRVRRYQKLAMKANRYAHRGGRAGRLFKRLLKRVDKRFKKAQREFNKFTKAGYKKSPEQMDKEIDLFGSTSLPNGKCMSSCHWFTLPGVVWTNFDPVEKHQICGNCAVRTQKTTLL